MGIGIPLSIFNSVVGDFMGEVFVCGAVFVSSLPMSRLFLRAGEESFEVLFAASGKLLAEFGSRLLEGRFRPLVVHGVRYRVGV